jgi:glyoxylase-like metal-dependent hydrolase (beta-lactamase superfamily II)
MEQPAVTPARPTLSYPCGDPPAAGELREIAPGLNWIRMPLPSSLSHINLWAIEDDGGWAIVDTGLRTEETADAWGRLFAGPLGGRRATRVFVTHMHPDHVGMAGWLTRKFDCRLWMTRLEYLTCRVLMVDLGREAPADAIAFCRRAGWSEDAIERYRARFGNFGKMMHALPDSYRRIVDGDVLVLGGREWHVVIGTGHSPEHACLHCPSQKLLISGDQVLPRISSNVSVHPTEPDADPLENWLASIAKVRQAVPNDVLVLPAHNEPFRGLHERLDHLEASQLRALERLRQSLQEERRVVDVFGALFARAVTGQDAMQLGLATGESLAHLNYLLRRGEATVRTDDHGVAWYRRA